ncbi:DNA topoisomerase I [Streptomyces filamentosus NRRL 11379]|nr:DNA topoisomerase I [Streptomyces filamentosus NRRL 11379]
MGLHARLIPASGRAAPGPTGLPADTATVPEKPQAEAPRGADPAVRAAGMAEVGLPFEWPLRAFAV